MNQRDYDDLLGDEPTPEQLIADLYSKVDKLTQALADLAARLGILEVGLLGSRRSH